MSIVFVQFFHTFILFYNLVSYNILVPHGVEGTKVFSERLKYARKLRKLSQEGLAKKLNTTKSTISNYENQYSSPSNDTLIELANILNVTTDFLLGRSDKVDGREDTKMDKRIKRLNDLIKNVPEGKEDIYIERIEAYIDGMTHANRDKGD